MICDLHDAWPGHDAMGRLRQLKQANPAFCVTLFSPPGRATPEWCESLPDWIELQAHGWFHPSPYECQDWGKQRLLEVLDSAIVRSYYGSGWCSPGWLSSPGVYEGLLERGFWVADQHLADHLRPPGLRTYYYEDSPGVLHPDRYHGHVGSDGVTNGIEQVWGQLVERVRAASHFEFCSQATCLGPDRDDPGPGAAAS